MSKVVESSLAISVVEVGKDCFVELHRVLGVLSYELRVDNEASVAETIDLVGKEVVRVTGERFDKLEVWSSVMEEGDSFGGREEDELVELLNDVRVRSSPCGVDESIEEAGEDARRKEFGVAKNRFGIC